MHEIIKKTEMADGSVVRFDIKAPRIAEKIEPGQFVIIRTHEGGERIPLTVADSDKEEGTISIVFQVVGKTTALMRSLEQGDGIKDLAGPLGRPSEIENVGAVIVVGGGTGIAIMHHITKGLRAAGNEIIGIIGARNGDLLIFESEMKHLCDELIVTTDDGSAGRQGFVTQPLEEILEKRDDIGMVFAIGPIIMMKNACKITEKFGVKTMVSLNPIMIDGTGMCGGCRVVVGNETKFCCVDGPEFDGHQVDFEKLEQRNAMYAADEKDSLLSSIKLRGK